MENNESMESTDACGMEPDKAGKEERLFTQEEVNGFIQSRLGQMKKQAAKESAAELGQREKELEAREMRLAVREELEKRGMPKGLSEKKTVRRKGAPGGAKLAAAKGKNPRWTHSGKHSVLVRS